MTKINSCKYIEFFKDYPNMQMVLSNWDWEIRWYLFNTFPVVIYTKKLFND